MQRHVYKTVIISSVSCMTNQSFTKVPKNNTKHNVKNYEWHYNLGTEWKSFLQLPLLSKIKATILIVMLDCKL